MNSWIKNLVDQVDREFPFVLVDVGSMGGIPLKWNDLRDYMQVVAFEGDTREYSKLVNTGNIRYLNCFLHEKGSESLKFFVTNSTGKSGILRPNMSFLSQFEDAQRFNVIKEELIPAEKVKTLDSIVEENNFRDVDFVKLDTEGGELFILRGGGKIFMPMVFAAQIEVEFAPMHENQPPFRQVDEFMANNGFSLMDLKRQFWKRKEFYKYKGKGQIIFGDALYFKKIDVLAQELSARKDKQYGRSKITKSILICFIYKMFDYAVSLARLGSELGYFDPDEAKNLDLLIRKYAAVKLPMAKRLWRLVYGALTKMRQKMQAPVLGRSWGYSDSNIGNIADI